MRMDWQDVELPRIASSDGSLAIIRRSRSDSIREGSAMGTETIGKCYCNLMIIVCQCFCTFDI